MNLNHYFLSLLYIVIYNVYNTHTSCVNKIFDGNNTFKILEKYTLEYKNTFIIYF